MTLTEEMRRLIRAKEENELTSMELYAHMIDQLSNLSSATRPGVLEELSADADEDIRQVASDFQTLARHQALSQDLDYVRQNSPLRPGTRIELFGGYDYYAEEGKPAWLNRRECYRATFLGFVARGEGLIPAGLVEFDEPVAVPGHQGRYGILLATCGLDSVAWGLTDDVVEVYVSNTPPDGSVSIRSGRDSAAALETHATLRVEETA